MNIKYLVLIVILFGALFYFSGTFLAGTWQKFVQFLCGAIIVVALLLFLLGMF